jgi:hypothetical protein
MTLTMDTSANRSCYKLVVMTDKGFTYSCQPGNGQTSCTITHNSGGQFSDGTSILVEVQKTCGTSLIETAEYSISGHF